MLTNVLIAQSLSRAKHSTIVTNMQQMMMDDLQRTRLEMCTVQESGLIYKELDLLMAMHFPSMQLSVG